MANGKTKPAAAPANSGWPEPDPPAPMDAESSSAIEARLDKIEALLRKYHGPNAI